MNYDKSKGAVFGLIVGVLLGSLSMSYFVDSKEETIKTSSSVNADTGATEVTEINYKNGRCHLSKDVTRFPKSLGGDSTSIYMRGSYVCENLDSKADVEIFKKALDKAVELGWVK